MAGAWDCYPAVLRMAVHLRRRGRLMERRRIMYRHAELREGLATWAPLDPDPAPIRSRPDFQSLLLDLAMPVDPFAGPD